VSDDAWGAIAVIMLILAIAGYYGFERWCEHREIMAGKQHLKDGEDGDDN